MDHVSVSHPTAKELAAFRLGKLTEAERTVVARHLTVCDSCRQAAQGGTLRPDDVSPRPLRGATVAAGNTAPAAGEETAPKPPPSSPPAGVPPELAEHSRYRILRELGKGGMGTVFQAKHRLMERLVAIKVINQSLLDHPEALQRFHQEVTTTAALPSHPNIVTAFDAEQAGDLHLLVMEYVGGWSLAQVLDKKGPLPVGYACRCVHQAALGLQHAFEHGMVHRDLKPQNLMVTAKGVVKILDFGLARMASERQRGRGLTQDGAVMGTPEYMAPEQATDARQADIRADIYSLGCTLYCLLAGQPPFVEDTVVKTILAHLDREALSLTELRPDVPPELGAVAARMMAKDPKQRFQTPAEAAQALAPFIGLKTPAAAVATPSAVRDTHAVPTVKSPTVRPTPPPVPRQSSLPAPEADWHMMPAQAPLLDVHQALVRSTGVRLVLWATAATLALGAVGIGLFAAGVFERKPAAALGRGTIVLDVSQPDVAVYIDEERISLAKPTEVGPVRLSLPAGSHHVRVAKKGFSDFRQDVNVTSDGRVPVEVRLERSPGTLVLRGLPDGATVLIDGKEAEVRAGVGFPLVAGRHQLKVTSAGHRDYSRTLNIQADTTDQVQVALPASPARLVLTVEPAGATVLIDGQETRMAPLPRGQMRLSVEPGKREIQVSKEGYHPRTETITVAANEEKPLSIELKPILAALVLTVDPAGADVFMDSQRVAAAPPERKPLRLEAPVGNRQIKVARDGYETRALQVTIRADQDNTLDVRLRLMAKEIKEAVRTLVTAETPARGTRRISGSAVGVMSVAIAPDGQTILSNGGVPYPQGPLGGNEVQLWEPRSTSCRKLKGKPGHKFPVTGLIFSSTGASALSVSSGRSDEWAIAWDLETDTVICQEDISKFRGLAGSVGAAFSPKGPILACYRNESVQRWDLTAKEKGAAIPAVNRVPGAKFLAFAPDLKQVLVAHPNGSLRLWDTTTGQDVQTFAGPVNLAVSAGAFSPDGRRLLCISQDQNIRVWDVNTGVEVACLTGHNQGVTCAAFSADANHVVSGSRDRTLRWWDVKTGQTLAICSGHTAEITCVAYSPRGNRVVSGSADRTVREWALPLR
jgi:WD40 repeat protein